MPSGIAAALQAGSARAPTNGAGIVGATPAPPPPEVERGDFLRALSLKQPFCQALLLRKITQESRTWKIKLPANGTGLWVAAHSTAKSAPQSVAMQGLRQKWPDMPPPDAMPKSCIVGFLHISNVVSYDDLPLAEREPSTTGPVVWQIDRTIPLPKPFPCAGSLGMWAPPKELPVPTEARQPRPAAYPHPATRLSHVLVPTRLTHARPR